MSSKKKKQQFMYSIDPDLYQRSHAPSSTIAMGMKPSQASALCWVDQVNKEQSLRERWDRTYDPAGKQETEKDAALARTLARAEARREAYLSRQGNPELHTILYGSRAATATAIEDGPAPEEQDKGGGDGEEGQQQQQLLQREAEMHQKKGHASVKYLEARYDTYSLAERFPDGPATANQGIGWAAAVGNAEEKRRKQSPATGAASQRTMTTADLYRPARQRPAVLAYHKPEDEDHALLFGYDLQPK